MDTTKAKCSGLPPETFFPQPIPSGRPPRNTDRSDRTLRRNKADAEYEIARLICKGGDGAGECPIRQECLDYAIQTKQKDGVWGGYTAEGRRSLKRKRKVA
jgi:hypothetical protein